MAGNSFNSKATIQLTGGATEIYLLEALTKAFESNKGDLKKVVTDAVKEALPQ